MANKIAGMHTVNIRFSRENIIKRTGLFSRSVRCEAKKNKKKTQNKTNEKKIAKKIIWILKRFQPNSSRLYYV